MVTASQEVKSEEDESDRCQTTEEITMSTSTTRNPVIHDEQCDYAIPNIFIVMTSLLRDKLNTSFLEAVRKQCTLRRLQNIPMSGNGYKKNCHKLLMCTKSFVIRQVHRDTFTATASTRELTGERLHGNTVQLKD